MWSQFILFTVLLVFSNAVTVSWEYDFGAGGADAARNWEDGTNWDTGVAPQEGDDVVIVVANIEDYVINIVSEINLNSFILDAATTELTGASASSITTDKFEWRSGIVTGELTITAGGMSCAVPQNFEGRTVTGVDASIVIDGDCDLGYCEIDLNDGSQFIVNEGATITAEEEVVQFDSIDLTNPGSFINNGKIVLTPLYEVNGQSWWHDVSFVHNGEIECLYSSEYGHCLEVRNYEGTAAVSESSGTFVVNSIYNDYLGDFDTWPPILLSGNFFYKEGHNITGNGVSRLWGDAVSCDDIDSSDCHRILEQTFTVPFHFTQLNFEDYIRVILDEDLEIDYCLWNGGLITGDGNLISHESMTIDYQGLTTAEMYIDGTSVIIKKHLDFIRGGILGTNGAKIIIDEDAQMDLHAGAYVGDDLDVEDNWDFTLENHGTISIFFDDYKPVETGQSVILNYGTFRYENLNDEYSNSGARPNFYVDDEGELHFKSTGTLELRIRGPATTGDIYEYSDTIDFYEASACTFGGELQIEFDTTYIDFTPAAGDRFKIIPHRTTAEDGFNPCFNDFETITAIGLGSGLKLGLDYNVPDEDLSKLSYVEVIVCNEADTCGSSNANQKQVDETTGDTNVDSTNTDISDVDTADNIDDTDSSSHLAIFTLFIVFLFF